MEVSKMDPHSSQRQIEHLLKSLNAHDKRKFESENVSKRMQFLENHFKELGINERDLKPSEREILIELRKLLCSVSSPLIGTSEGDTKTTYSSHVANFPLGSLINAGLNVVGDVTKKEILKTQLQKTVSKIQSKNAELLKVRKDVVNVLHGELADQEKRRACLAPEKQEILIYTSEFYQNELSKLQQKKGDKPRPVNCQKIKEMLERYETLKKHNNKLKEHLDIVSHNNSLPPNKTDAQTKLADKKTYLESLLHQISNFESIADMSSSVFS